MKFGSDVVAQVNTNSLTYDGAANFFLATEKNASISVNASVSGAAAIWLGNDNYVGDIRTIDATNSSVKAELAGNDADNIISAGSGDSSLWGGNLGSDVLIGGSGRNTFFYTVGNGSDNVQGAHDGDLVYLSQVTLDQIASTNITAGGVAINFKDGGSLQVDSTADVTYQLADGSRYSANHEQLAWNGKSI